jgi:hypothetical protein
MSGDFPYHHITPLERYRRLIIIRNAKVEKGKKLKYHQKKKKNEKIS